MTTVGTGEAAVAPGRARSITSRNCSSFCAMRRMALSDASPTKMKFSDRTCVHFASARAGRSTARSSRIVRGAPRIGVNPNARMPVEDRAMTPSRQHVRYRRDFLRFLAASPLMAYGWRDAWAQEPAAAPLAKDVLSVMDFEALARPALPPAHWGYMAGVDDNLTLQANVAGYKTIQLRPRRLVDVSTIDTGVELFGQRFTSPVFLCPVGGHRMFHAEGEVATARAAKARNALQVLSSASSLGVEPVATARGGGLWYQLYIPQSWDDTEKLVRRVEAAGCPVLVWTI